jgi:hypothetical protein
MWNQQTLAIDGAPSRLRISGAAMYFTMGASQTALR